MMNYRGRLRLLSWLGVMCGILGLLFLGRFAADKIQAARMRGEIERVRQAMERGQVGPARKDLKDLDRRWPGRGEILMLLGRCEESLGRPERALAAWVRIPPSDALFASRRGVSRVSS